MKISWQLAEEKRDASRTLHKTFRRLRLKIRRKDKRGLTTRRTLRKSGGLRGSEPGTSDSASLQHPQLRFHPFQPQSHFHLAHHRDAIGEMRLRFIVITGSPVQFAQPNMAMRDERTHAECFSEGESLAIVLFRLVDIKRIFARRDLAEEQKSVRLVSSFFVLTGESQGALCGGTGIRVSPG